MARLRFGGPPRDGRLCGLPLRYARLRRALAKTRQRHCCRRVRSRRSTRHSRTRRSSMPGRTTACTSRATAEPRGRASRTTCRPWKYAIFVYSRNSTIWSIATHGRAIWVMDDVRPVQQSACVEPTSPLVIGPRRPSISSAIATMKATTPTSSPFQPGGGFASAAAAEPPARSTTGYPVRPKTRPPSMFTISKGIAAPHRGRTRHLYGEGSSYWISNSDGKNEFDLRLRDRRRSGIEHDVFLPRSRRRTVASARHAT